VVNWQGALDCASNREGEIDGGQEIGTPRTIKKKDDANRGLDEAIKYITAAKRTVR